MERQQENTIDKTAARLIGEAVIDPDVIDTTGYKNLFDSLFREDPISARQVLIEMKNRGVDIRSLLYPDIKKDFLKQDETNYEPEEILTYFSKQLYSNPDLTDSFQIRKFLINLDLLTDNHEELLENTRNFVEQRRKELREEKNNG